MCDAAGSGAQGRAVLDIKGLWHPCAVSRVAGDTVVPNDLYLGATQPDGSVLPLLNAMACCMLCISCLQRSHVSSLKSSD